MKKKPRVVWCVEPKEQDYYSMYKGLICYNFFKTKKLASRFGKPIKFVEVVKEKDIYVTISEQDELIEKIEKIIEENFGIDNPYPPTIDGIDANGCTFKNVAKKIVAETRKYMEIVLTQLTV